MVINLDDDTASINTFNNPVMTSDNGRARIMSDNTLHTGSDQRGIGTQQRHSLALHV